MSIQRMKRHIITSIGAILVALGFATTASAQTTAVVDTAHWTLTPFVGVGFSGDLDSGTGALGATGGYIWNERVALEGEFGVLPSSEQNGVVELDSRVWSLTGNILYHFNGRESWVPYGAFGMGFGHGSVDTDDTAPVLQNFDTASSNFVATFGGGVERSIRQGLAFRGDLRYFFGGDLVPDYWRLSTGLTFDLGRH